MMSIKGNVGRNRRMVAAVAIGAMVLFGSLADAHAQQYPTRPVRIVVGFAPGGPSDIISRVIGAKMGEILGQQFVIENRTGGGGTIATDVAGRSEPDGYTILNTPVANAVNETLTRSLRSKVGEGLISVAPLAETASVVVVHPSLGVKNVQELIALAKAKPDDTLYATAGRGSATHLTAEVFNMMAGTKMQPVHYKGGGEVLKDLLTGEVKIMFSAIAPVLEYVKDGRLIGLATTGPKRDPQLPNLPTVAEAGLPGFDVRQWQGFTAPAGVPPAIVAKLASATADALKSPEVKSALQKQGFSPLTGTTEEFDAFYRSEVAKFRKVIEASGMEIQ